MAYVYCKNCDFNEERTGTYAQITSFNKFCPKCGNTIITDCSQCNHTIESREDIYCRKCGNKHISKD